MKLTIKDIAKMAGVSTTTVSLILNNKGDRFNEQTVKKVLDIVQEHNYQPNFFAQNMVTKKTKTVGVIVPDIKDYFFNQLFEGIESFLTDKGYGVILYRTSHFREREVEALQFMQSRQVSGIIFATPYLLEVSEYKKICDNVPFILLDRGLLERETGKFYVDEYSGMCDLIEYLLAKGHSKIAFIKENKDYYQLTERTDAYYDVLNKNSVPINEDLIIETDLSVEGGFEAMQSLLNIKDKFSAVVCTNDYLAVGAYLAIEKKGYKIPNDISVVGFDDIEISSYLTPSLTTVSQPIFDMGSEVANCLYQAIEKETQPKENKIFTPKLVERNSVRTLEL